MTEIVASILIDRPVETVFDYVTTPAYWPQWHPSSDSVNLTIAKSLDVGEQVVEDIKVGGRRDKVVWTVIERERPGRWVIQGQGASGGGAMLTYRLTAAGSATLFNRDLSYRMPNAALAVVDWLLVRHIMTAASHKALARLKAVLESA